MKAVLLIAILALAGLAVARDVTSAQFKVRQPDRRSRVLNPCSPPPLVLPSSACSLVFLTPESLNGSVL